MDQLDELLSFMNTLEEKAEDLHLQLQDIAREAEGHYDDAENTLIELEEDENAATNEAQRLFNHISDSLHAIRDMAD